MNGLNELRDKIHENAKTKGFYDVEKKALNIYPTGENKDLQHAFFAQKIALIHSELSEALEADRKDNRAKFDNFVTHDVLSEFELLIKNTVEDELADVIIRTLDVCGWLGIDIQKHVELKMKYNELRDYKHGKKY